MLQEIILAIVQAATEFLPISSSGHLALFSKLMALPQENLFLIAILHLASLLAVLIFTRKEISELLKFNKDSRKLWLFLIIATIPAGLFGLLFSDLISNSLGSLLAVGIFFFITGIILLSTKKTRAGKKLNSRKSFAIGLAQILALFPGISRSGTTISTALHLGIDREKAAKFSFLLFIPLVIGANLLEFGNAYFSYSLLFAFFICFILSLAFLSLLLKVLTKGKFWVFGIYCFLIGTISLLAHFLL